ncbi:MAG: hypothetical protein QHH75_04775 [Bacillota bacterium]|nr:hypothetical protein [Bacillota bacterium]
MSKKINRTKRKLKDIIRGFSAHILDENKNDTGRLRCIYTDREMVKIIKDITKREYTERAIALARSRQNIEPCTPHGGARPGAGRKRGTLTFTEKEYQILKEKAILSKQHEKDVKELSKG